MSEYYKFFYSLPNDSSLYMLGRGNYYFGANIPSELHKTRLQRFNNHIRCIRKALCCFSLYFTNQRHISIYYPYVYHACSSKHYIQSQQLIKSDY
jgi:hypothetical protein